MALFQQWVDKNQVRRSSSQSPNAKLRLTKVVQPSANIGTLHLRGAEGSPSPVSGWKNSDDERNRRSQGNHALENFVNTRRVNEYTIRPKRPPSCPLSRDQLELYEKYPIATSTKRKEHGRPEQEKRQFDIRPSESHFPTTFHDLHHFLISNNAAERDEDADFDDDEERFQFHQTSLFPLCGN
jgi:hypothetical protein